MLIKQTIKQRCGISNLAWPEVAGHKISFIILLLKSWNTDNYGPRVKDASGRYDFRIQWTLTTLILGETDLCYVILHTNFETMTSVYIWWNKNIPIVSI
jgi:hypothetical protein